MTTRSFKAGELQGAIKRRGLSQATFAFAVGLHPSTIFKACQGEEIGASSFGKIKRGLDNLPVLTTRVSA